MRRTYMVFVVTCLLLSGCSISKISNEQNLVDKVLIETATGEALPSDEYMKLVSDRGQFAFFVLPTQTETLKDGLLKDIYHRRGSKVEVVYHGVTTDNARYICLQNIESLKKDNRGHVELEMYPEIEPVKKYGCQFVYGPATIYFEAFDSKIDLYDRSFWMLGLDGENNSGSQFAGMGFIDLCDQEWGKEYGIKYIRCGLYDYPPMGGYRYALQIQDFKGDISTSEFCGDVMNYNMLPGRVYNHEGCDVGGNTCGEMKGEVCYTKQGDIQGYNRIYNKYRIFTTNPAIGKLLMDGDFIGTGEKSYFDGIPLGPGISIDMVPDQESLLQLREQRGWFSSTLTFEETKALGNGKQQDFYKRNDTKVTVTYDIVTTQKARAVCLEEVEQTKDRSTLSQVNGSPTEKEWENSARKYGCEFIYGPAAINIEKGNVTFDLSDQDFWMLVLEWNYGAYIHTTLHIDLCLPFQGRDPSEFLGSTTDRFSRYEVSDQNSRYMWCSYFFEDEQGLFRGRDTLFIRPLDGYDNFATTQELCENTVENKYDLSRACFTPDVCKPTTDSQRGMRGNVCYTKIVPEDMEAVNGIHHGYSMIMSGYTFSTSNYGIGEWLVTNSN